MKTVDLLLVYICAYFLSTVLVQCHIEPKVLETFNIPKIGPAGRERGISYYISDYKVTHNEALALCQKNYFGRLLTILTKEEDDFVRMRLQMHGMDDTEPVFTAGRYNEDNTGWEWSTLASSIPQSLFNWRTGEPTRSDKTACISLLGSLSNYGGATTPCNDEQYFICQILF